MKRLMMKSVTAVFVLHGLVLLLLMQPAWSETVRLAWQADPNATGYEVRYDDGASPIQRIRVMSGTTEELVWEIGPGTYQFQVVTICDQWYGDVAPAQEITVTAKPPLPAQNFTVEQVVDNPVEPCGENCTEVP